MTPTISRSVDGEDFLLRSMWGIHVSLQGVPQFGHLLNNTLQVDCNPVFRSPIVLPLEKWHRSGSTEIARDN